jgi:Lon protease-like protein
MSFEELNSDGIEPISDTELEELPIFPLPQCVLLPGGLLPLHVFEPRYRELTRYCLDGNRPMGVARLRPQRELRAAGSYDRSRPAVFSHVGVGRIICSEELEDGRFLLLLRGVARVVIDHELPTEHSFRRVAARRLGDGPADPEKVRHLHQQLMALCDRLAMVLDEGGRQLRELACGEIPGACADAVAAALMMDADERQALLEQTNPHARLTAALAHVSRLLCQVVPCDDVVN